MVQLANWQISMDTCLGRCHSKNRIALVTLVITVAVSFVAIDFPNLNRLRAIRTVRIASHRSVATLYPIYALLFVKM